MNKSSTNTNYEASSGILDLEKVEGFGESGMENMSLSKSSAFNPGEMTGRSTGTEDVQVQPTSSGSVHLYEDYGRHSLALDSLQSHMDKQTLEINDIMRHSIATNYSFHSNRDLTADEASLVVREAPLPVTQGTQMNFQDSILMNHSNISVGAYFKNRCPEFGRILTKTDSPNRSMQQSITDVSSHTNMEPVTKIVNHTFKLDSTLDSVPVRQPKVVNSENATEKFTMDSDIRGKVIDKINPSAMTISNVRNMEAPKSVYLNKGLNESSINLAPGPTNLNHKGYGQKGSGTKSFMTSTKPTDVLLRNLQSSLRMVTEDTEGSIENSLSISKIADYLGKQSNISVTDMLQLNNQTKHSNRKHPLTELHINLLENKRVDQCVVTNLKDTRKTETASSSGTMNTVISLDNLYLGDENVIPEVIATQDAAFRNDDVKSECDDAKKNSIGRSKSPTSKSQSTLSTVHENITSFKSVDSPSLSRKGETRISHNIPSPNIGYRELDKSVDWLEVLQEKHSGEDCLATEKWADIQVSQGNGFVGVSCPVVITVSTLTNCWLTAKIEFDDLPNEGRDVVIELPRLPLLLSPGKTEQFTINLTSNIEMNTKLPFTMYLKDASIDGDTAQKGFLEVNIKMPTIQAVSCDGVNKVCFPIVKEKSSLTKFFVLISDCPVDLKLELVITEGESMFVIKNVQEIKRNEVSKALMDRQSSLEEQQTNKSKAKGLNKQLCRLANDNAIKVTITFNSPKLSELGLSDETTTDVNGTLSVNMIGGNVVLKKVCIVGAVGTAKLAVELPPAGKLHISNEPISVPLSNTGSACGCWVVKFHSSTFTENNFPFRVSPAKLEIPAGGTAHLNVMFTGSDDGIYEATLLLEDIATGNKSTLDIVGGTDRPKSFPIKTNFSNMSWVCAGRKELSLKNFSDNKVQIRCQIVGEGYALDAPGAEARGAYCLTFAPRECRPLPIVFAPPSARPHAAALHVIYDKNTDFSRKVKLHGCAGGAALRWGAGLVTCGDTALVRAQPRAPLQLALRSRAPAPAFLAASVRFNVQYACAERHARLEGARRVVSARAQHTLTLRLDWARLERRARAARASALATLTVLTGPEYTRLRILRILRSDSSDGEPDTSLLPDHLKVLTEKFEGEDPNMGKHLESFQETKSSLNELIESLQELTAQIDLPQDFAEDNTIVISDDTMVEHHTLCD